MLICIHLLYPTLSLSIRCIFIIYLLFYLLPYWYTNAYSLSLFVSTCHLPNSIGVSL